VQADETVEVSMTVNGTRTQLTTPPRLTLADALRGHLGLTGTHLGCEHGVCGMCTVLVDGQAARACLLFVCQLEGSEVVTVEGLGRPDALHPLQESFGRHHGLQCGFCTPGFLMSSYDLLDHRPRVPRDELPEELSGVICRCTGYRNIVDAVADVAEANPDGIPAPGNCGHATFVARAGVGLVTGQRAAAEPSPTPGNGAVEDIRLPQGEPTIHVELARDLTASTDDVARVLADVRVLARCLPGVELTEDLGDRWHRGRAKVSLGPVKLSFASVAHVVEHEYDHIRVLAQGLDAGGGRAQADIRLRVHGEDSGSRLAADARVFLTGRIAQFGRSLAGDVSRRMFEQFATTIEQVANGAETTALLAAPSPLRLVTTTVLDRARSSWRRRRESWRQHRAGRRTRRSPGNSHDGISPK
jgi:aerobic-type carbon monoxide dehydrogenase small subunit (CoxS/CutS family)/carbon monoxide dehydrogenase subunit G